MNYLEKTLESRIRGNNEMLIIQTRMFGKYAPLDNSAKPVPTLFAELFHERGIGAWTIRRPSIPFVTAGDRPQDERSFERNLL